MRTLRRRTAIEVRGGKVQRKNRSQRTPLYRISPRDGLQIVEERPGPRFRHILTRSDIERFIALLPEWNEISTGLSAIILDRGDDGLHGWFMPGYLAICAWPLELAEVWHKEFVREHRPILDLLNVPRMRIQDDPLEQEAEPQWDYVGNWIDPRSIAEDEEPEYLVQFNDESVRGFQLLHIFLHELGHHCQYTIRSRTRKRAEYKETFAENYANRHAETIFAAYIREFGDSSTHGPLTRRHH